MKYFYAIVNTDSSGKLICTGVINTYKEMNDDTHIKIADFDESLIGKVYDGKGFVVVE